MFCLNTVYVYICYTTFLLSILHFLFLKYFYLVFPIHHPLLSCCVVKISHIFQPCKKKTVCPQQKPFPSEKSPHQKIIISSTLEKKTRRINRNWCSKGLLLDRPKDEKLDAFVERCRKKLRKAKEPHYGKGSPWFW